MAVLTIHALDYQREQRTPCVLKHCMTSVETFQSLAYLARSSDVRIFRLYWFLAVKCWYCCANNWASPQDCTDLWFWTTSQPSKHTFSKPLQNLSVSHFNAQEKTFLSKQGDTDISSASVRHGYRTNCTHQSCDSMREKQIFFWDSNHNSGIYNLAA